MQFFHQTSYPPLHSFPWDFLIPSVGWLHMWIKGQTESLTHKLKITVLCESAPTNNIINKTWSWGGSCVWEHLKGRHRNIFPKRSKLRWWIHTHKLFKIMVSRMPLWWGIHTITITIRGALERILPLCIYKISKWRVLLQPDSKQHCKFKHPDTNGFS